MEFYREQMDELSYFPHIFNLEGQYRFKQKIYMRERRSKGLDKYYLNNKTELNKKVVCDCCGCKVSKQNLKRHKKTKKCKKLTLKLISLKS